MFLIQVLYIQMNLPDVCFQGVFSFLGEHIGFDFQFQRQLKQFGLIGGFIESLRLALDKTNNLPLKIGGTPKGKDSFPTTIFQELCGYVSFRKCCHP